MKVFAKGIQIAVTVLISALALSACGSYSSSKNSTVPPASMAKAVVSQGVVTAKGSVFVNGIEFSTAGATITIDDNPGIESDLKLGMTVKVRGISDDTTKKGTAIKIEARDALEGSIESVDIANNTITVMGQVVKIEDNITRLNDDDTVKLFSAAAFSVGNIVEVNGFADDTGGLRATRVAKKISGEFESKGFVINLGATSFDLSLIPGGASFITVNFTAGQLPAGTANGSQVQVKSLAAPAAGAVTASLIKLEDKLGVTGEKVETEGIVASGGTLASFVINGQQVVTDSSTIFEGGLSTDFAPGVKVEAQGQLNASGAIVASKIIFRSNIKIEGDASGVSASGLTVLGKVIGINQFTRVDSGPIANGSHVEVRANFDRNGNIIAARIIVQGASNKALLQGPVTAADSTAGTLAILGFSLVSDGSTLWKTSSTTGDLPVTKSAFFAQLTVNSSVVKVTWNNFTATTAPIKEAEIELGK
jgi:hypothetical protein